MLPPSYSERLSPSQWTNALRMHGLVCLLSVLFDVALVVVLGLSDSLDQSVVRWFGLINIPALAVAMVISALAAQVPRLQRAGIMVPLVAATAGTTVVWLQATGTLTSYFLIMGVVIIAGYRLAFGYLAGALALGMLAVLHTGAVALELAGVLKPEALFLGTYSPVYSVLEYRLLALSSILMVYWLTFVASSVAMNTLRARDLALAEARRQVAHLGARGNRGRLSGRVLSGEYTVAERLGCGGFGEVYAATRLSDERRAAVKVLHPHLVQREGFVERFRREVALLERIPARYTAPLLSIGFDPAEHAHYFAMELLRGEDLASAMKSRGPLGPDELLDLARGIAEALDAAHAAEVVHRDLKPANIFLVDGAGPAMAGRIRLLDFGMSRALGAEELTLTASNAMIGTIGYMSPEQALGQRDRIGPASDRFAMAAILYRAMTGRAAFQSADPLAAIHEVVNVQPPEVSLLRPEISSQVDAVISLGMAKRIEDRYSSAAALVADLEAALAGRLPDPVLARAASQRAGQANTLTSPEMLRAG
jgi:hypothetical protein